MADLDPGLAVIPDSDPGRGDDFLRVRQISMTKILNYKQEKDERRMWVSLRPVFLIE